MDFQEMKEFLKKLGRSDAEISQLTFESWGFHVSTSMIEEIAHGSF